MELHCRTCNKSNPRYECGHCTVPYCSQICASTDWKKHKEQHFKEHVMGLLNDWDNKSKLQQGIRMLHMQFLPNVKEPIPLLLDDCDHWPSNRAQIARQTTKRHNYYQIELCHDVLNKEWQYTKSSTVWRHDPDKYSHVAVVLLHEFGHILDQENKLTNCKHTGEEEKASCFANQFLLHGKNALSYCDYL